MLRSPPPESIGLPIFWLVGIFSLAVLAVGLFVYQFLTLSTWQRPKSRTARAMSLPQEPPRQRRSRYSTQNRKRKQSRQSSLGPSRAASDSPTILVNTRSPGNNTGRTDLSSTAESLAETLVEDIRIKQPYDAFLVVDVEATCCSGVGFDYPNEIIEWPVVLLRWNDRTYDGRGSELVQVAEFRSYIRPTWKPELSTFCTALTGITQADVDLAPTWPEMLESFSQFLVEHGLIHPRTGARLEKFMFCSDGPFDIRDFVAKQSHISKIPIPEYLQGDILDVRKAVACLVTSREQLKVMTSTGSVFHRHHTMKKLSLSIPLQLHVLSLPPFAGRQHCGLDDARNVARILTELARTPLRVEPNTYIHPHRHWWWMGPHGEVAYPDNTSSVCTLQSRFAFT